MDARKRLCHNGKVVVSARVVDSWILCRRAVSYTAFLISAVYESKLISVVEDEIAPDEAETKGNELFWLDIFSNDN